MYIGGNGQKRWLGRSVAALMLFSVTAGYFCHPAKGMAGPQSTGPAKPVTTPAPSAPTSQPSVTPAPTKTSVTPEDLQRALARIDNASFLLNVVIAVVGALALILALASIGAVIFSRDVIRGWVNRQARETAKEETSKVTTRLWLGLSYLEWARVTPGMEEGLDLAIRLGIQALEAATRAKDEEYVAIAKSNLAYYYAQQQAQDKKEIALQYAREARANIVQFPKRLTWLTNDIYVRMMFSDCDGMAPIKRDAEDLMNRFSDIREELRGYIEEMKKKCPALDDGASR